jgi:hypothetical protein
MIAPIYISFLIKLISFSLKIFFITFSFQLQVQRIPPKKEQYERVITDIFAICCKEKRVGKCSSGVKKNILCTKKSKTGIWCLLWVISIRKIGRKFMKFKYVLGFLLVDSQPHPTLCRPIKNYRTEASISGNPTYGTITQRTALIAVELVWWKEVQCNVLCYKKIFLGAYAKIFLDIIYGTLR